MDFPDWFKILALDVYVFICWEENSSIFLLIFTGSSQRRRGCYSLVGQRSGHLLDQFLGVGGGHSVLEDSSPTVHPSCPFLLIWDESPKQRWPGPQPRPAEHLPFQKDHLWLGRSIKTGVRSPAGVAESLGLEGGRRKLKVLPQLFNWSCIFHCCFLQGALMNW